MAGYAMSLGCNCCCDIFDMRIAAGQSAEIVDLEITRNSESGFAPSSYDTTTGYFELAPGASWRSAVRCPSDYFFVGLLFPSGTRLWDNLRLHLDYDDEDLPPSDGIVLDVAQLAGPLQRVSASAVSPWAATSTGVGPHFRYELDSDWDDAAYEDGQDKSEGTTARLSDIYLNVFDDSVELREDLNGGLLLSNKSTLIERLHRPRKETRQSRVVLTNTGTQPLRWKAIFAGRIAKEPTSRCEVQPKTYVNFPLNEPLPVSCELDVHSVTSVPSLVYGSYSTTNSIPFSNVSTEVENAFTNDVRNALPITIAAPTMTHRAVITPLAIVAGIVTLQIDLFVSYSRVQFNSAANDRLIAANKVLFGTVPTTIQPVRPPGSPVTNGDAYATLGHAIFSDEVATIAEVYRTEIGWPADDPRARQDVLNPLTPFGTKFFILSGTVARSSADFKNTCLARRSFSKTITANVPTWARGELPALRILHNTVAGDDIALGSTPIIAITATSDAGHFPDSRVSSLTWDHTTHISGEIGMTMEFSSTTLAGFVAIIRHTDALQQ